MSFLFDLRWLKDVVLGAGDVVVIREERKIELESAVIEGRRETSRRWHRLWHLRKKNVEKTLMIREKNKKNASVEYSYVQTPGQCTSRYKIK